jgi:hypothetical protein
LEQVGLVLALCLDDRTAISLERWFGKRLHQHWTARDPDRKVTGFLAVLVHRYLLSA